MWVRLQLDIGPSDLAYGLLRLSHPFDAANYADLIEKQFSPGGNALAVLSVRSGLDLLLGVLGWAPGSEIVYSALNIPDMTMVARQHGIVPVPADLDVERLAPNLELIERAITSKTRAILVAHLYGNFVPMEPIVQIARKHGLMLIEDCAENFDGVYVGHPDADISLFSFGPLKTATSLAGGVLRAKDSALLAKLREAHAHWPSQSRRDFLNRLCKYGTMRLFGTRFLYGAVRRVARSLVGDVDKLIHFSAKSFRDDEIMRRLRQRPCGPLLASMARRLSQFDSERIRQRTANGRLLADLLRGKVSCPGADVVPHNYWLFPAIVADPQRTISALEAAGFDATQAQSMQACPAPPDRPDLDPVNVREVLKHMILLPCYPGIPEAELRRMAEVVIEIEKSAASVQSLRVTLQPAETQVGGDASAPRPTPSEPVGQENHQAFA